MENQHRLIEGYRDFENTVVDKINDVKQMENQVGSLINKMAQDAEVDHIMLLRAREHLQIGFMLAVRSVAKPKSDL